MSWGSWKGQLVESVAAMGEVASATGVSVGELSVAMSSLTLVPPSVNVADYTGYAVDDERYLEPSDECAYCSSGGTYLNLRAIKVCGGCGAPR